MSRYLNPEWSIDASRKTFESSWPGSFLEPEPRAIRSFSCERHRLRVI